MSMLDTYRNNLLRKREEAAKLNQDLAKEQAKIAPLQQKIISANAAIGRTKSASTIKSKLNEIERANKAIADTQKKVGDIQKKLAQKEKEIAAEQSSHKTVFAKVPAMGQIWRDFGHAFSFASSSSRGIYPSPSYLIWMCCTRFPLDLSGAST